MDSSDLLPRLNLLIKEQCDDLRRYFTGSKPNQFVLKKRKENVNVLIDIYNSLVPLGDINQLVVIQNSIHRLKVRDPEIDEILLFLKFGDKRRKTGTLSISFTDYNEHSSTSLP